MKKIIAFLSCVAGLALAAPPTYYRTVDFSDQSSSQFKIITGQGNTPRIQFTLLESGVPFDASTYTVEFRYDKSKVDAADTNGMGRLVGTVASSVVTFVSYTNSFLETYDDGYAALVLRKTGEQVTYVRGRITITTAPEIVAPIEVYSWTTNFQGYIEVEPVFSAWTNDPAAVDRVMEPYLPTNGSRAMGANLNFGGNRGTNAFGLQVVADSINDTLGQIYSSGLLSLHAGAFYDGPLSSYSGGGMSFSIPPASGGASILLTPAGGSASSDHLVMMPSSGGRIYFLDSAAAPVGYVDSLGFHTVLGAAYYGNASGLTNFSNIDLAGVLTLGNDAGQQDITGLDDITFDDPSGSSSVLSAPAVLGGLTLSSSGGSLTLLGSDYPGSHVALRSDSSIGFYPNNVLSASVGTNGHLNLMGHDMDNVGGVVGTNNSNLYLANADSTEVLFLFGGYGPANGGYISLYGTNYSTSSLRGDIHLVAQGSGAGFIAQAGNDVALYIDPVGASGMRLVGGGLLVSDNVITNFSYYGSGAGLTGVPVPTIAQVLASGNNGNGASVTNIGHLIPASSNAYDLGSAAHPWRSLYVSTNTIYFDGYALSVSGDQIALSDGTNTPVPYATEAWVQDSALFSRLHVMTGDGTRTVSEHSILAGQAEVGGTAIATNRSMVLGFVDNLGSMRATGRGSLVTGEAATRNLLIASGDGSSVQVDGAAAGGNRTVQASGGASGIRLQMHGLETVTASGAGSSIEGKVAGSAVLLASGAGSYQRGYFEDDVSTTAAGSGFMGYVGAGGDSDVTGAGALGLGYTQAAEAQVVSGAGAVSIGPNVASNVNCLVIGSGRSSIGDGSIVASGGLQSAYFAVGGVPAGDYLAVSTTGTITLNGEATVWEDLRFPARAADINPGATTVVPDVDTLALDFTTACTTNYGSDHVYFVAQFPHSKKLESDICPHVHFWQANANQTNMWFMRYKWVDVGETNPANWTVLGYATNVMPYVSGALHQLAEFPKVSGTDAGVSSIMLIKLYRDGTFGTGDGQLLEFDIHYEIDSLGSDTELQK